ncbi:MAG TPA: universal stress protein [bacterium]|nr:universal stress protein [bacterium]
METTLRGPVVLAPTDLSQASVSAVTFAADLARQLDGTLALLRVLLPREVEEGLAQGKFVNQQMDEGRVYLRWWYTTFVPEAARRTVPVREFVAVGHPEDEIPAVAESLGTTMIAMATHARSGFRRAVLGSVAEAVVRRAPCPVIMLRGPVQAWTTPRPEATPVREPAGAVAAS